MRLFTRYFHYSLWFMAWMSCSFAAAVNAEQFTVDACIQMAFEHNPELSQAKKAHTESVLRSEYAQTRLYPTLDVGAKAGYVSELSTMKFDATSFQPGTGMPIVTIPGREVEVGEHQQMSISLNLKQPVYMGGRITNSIAGYKIGAAIADGQVDEVGSRIRFNVIEAFYQLAKARELKKIAIGVRDLTTQHLKDVENLVSQGMRLKSDLLPVELKRLQAELDIVQAENGELRAEQQLAERIGMSGEEPLDILVNWNESPPWPIPVEFSPEKFTRPEQDMVRKNLELAGIGVQMTKGERLPEVSFLLGSYYGWPGFVNGDPEWTPWWQAGVNVSWNIFDMGGRNKKVQEAHIKQNRLKEAVRALDRKVALDRINTRLTYVECRRKLDIAKEKVAMALENHRNMRNNYKTGVATNTDYLNAETELANARNAEVVTAADVRIAWADYLRALGKGGK